MGKKSRRRPNKGCNNKNNNKSNSARPDTTPLVSPGPPTSSSASPQPQVDINELIIASMMAISSRGLSDRSMSLLADADSEDSDRIMSRLADAEDSDRSMSLLADAEDEGEDPVPWSAVYLSVFLQGLEQCCTEFGWLVVPLLEGLAADKSGDDDKINKRVSPPGVHAEDQCLPILMWVCQWKFLRHRSGGRWRATDKLVEMVLRSGANVHAVMPNNTNALFMAAYRLHRTQCGKAIVSSTTS